MCLRCRRRVTSLAILGRDDEGADCSGCRNCQKSRRRAAASSPRSSVARSPVGRCVNRACVGPWCCRTRCAAQRILSVSRRAKYLVLETAIGSLIVHLGMSGSLRLVRSQTRAGSARSRRFGRSTTVVCLRLTDPRRFGSIHFHEGDWREHWLIRDLGVEPLDNEFDGDFLHRAARDRRVAIKLMLMDAACGRWRGQHLRERIAVPGRHPTAHRRGPNQSRSICAARPIGTGGAGASDPRRAARRCGTSSMNRDGAATSASR